MPSAASASPSASPSGRGSRGEHVVRALDERHRGAHARERLRHLDAHGPAAEHEQPARDLGRAPVASRFVQTPSSSRRPGIGGITGSEPVAITMCVGGVGRRSPTSTRPGRDEPALAAEEVDALRRRASDLAGVVVAGDHEVAPGERLRRRRASPVTASRAPGASRAARSASPGRSSVFDGMQAQ